MRAFISRLYVRATQQNGQALTEYSVILALVVVVCLIALGTMGTDINAVLGSVNAALAGA